MNNLMTTTSINRRAITSVTSNNTVVIREYRGPNKPVTYGVYKIGMVQAYPIKTGIKSIVDAIKIA